MIGLLDIGNQNLPPLPEKGVSPFSANTNVIERTYRAYYANKELVEKHLIRHPRESTKDFDYRKKLAYSLKKTSWSANFLTKTINNNRYKIIRNFDDKHRELSILSANRIPSGKPWDAVLQEALLEALLGGVSYLFIDRKSVGIVKNDDINGYLGCTVLRVNQVENIIMKSNGFVSQCSIITEGSNYSTITRYFEENGVSVFEVYQNIDKQGYEKIESGVNDLGVAPIIPIVIRGDLNDPATLSTPVQSISVIDIDIMNLMSDSRHAFSYHNYPIVALPRGKGSIDSEYNISTGIDDIDIDDSLKGSLYQNNRDKVELGAVQGVRYNKDDGVPMLLEPENIHVDKTLELIAFLDSIIKDILGIGSGDDHPLASGYAKSFSFHNTNETHNFIHSILENIEYQTWYMVALMLNGSSLEDFQDFKENVNITHPTNFDPTGGTSWQRLQESTQSLAFKILPDEIKKEILKVYWTAALKDFRSPDGIEDLFKNFNLVQGEIDNGSNSTTTAGSSNDNGRTGIQSGESQIGRTESQSARPAGAGSSPIS